MDYFKIYATISKNIYYSKYKKIKYNGIELEANLIEWNKLNNKEQKKIIKSYISRKQKNKRIKIRLNKMNKENMWFCTWTIEDKYMNKNHNRKLKELYKDYKYIINEDMGKETKRKHFHGVIESKEKPKEWKYGYCQFKKVKNFNDEALARYINKLCMHATKETAKRIMYSRNK